MIIIDIFKGIVDWVKIKTHMIPYPWNMFMRTHTVVGCIKARIMLRRLRKII